MAGSDYVWEGGGLDALEKGLLSAIESTQAAAVTILRYYQPLAQAWMKANRKWTDRTDAARSGLYTAVEVDGSTAILWFSHGANVPYGKFLELAFGGRFAIIGPALDYFYPRIMATVRQALAGRGVRGYATRPGTQIGTVL